MKKLKGWHSTPGDGWEGVVQRWVSGAGQTIRPGASPSGLINSQMMEMEVVPMSMETNGMMNLAHYTNIHSFVN